MPPFSIINLIYLPFLKFKNEKFNNFICIIIYIFYLVTWIIIFNIIILCLIPLVWFKTFYSILKIPECSSALGLIYYVQWLFLGLPYLLFKHFFVDFPNFMRLSFKSVENKSRLSEISKLGFYLCFIFFN